MNLLTEDLKYNTFIRMFCLQNILSVFLCKGLSLFRTLCLNIRDEQEIVKW